MTSAFLLAAVLLWRPPVGPSGTHPWSVTSWSFQGGSASASPFASHRFVDQTNVPLTVGETGALLVDGATTQRALHRYPGAAYEADPLARPFVVHGWPGEVVAGTLAVAADLGLRSVFHRTNHHRLERWVPMLVASVGLTSAIHNTFVMNHIASQLAAGSGGTGGRHDP